MVLNTKVVSNYWDTEEYITPIPFPGNSNFDMSITCEESQFKILLGNVETTFPYRGVLSRSNAISVIYDVNVNKVTIN